MEAATVTTRFLVSSPTPNHKPLLPSTARLRRLPRPLALRCLQTPDATLPYSAVASGLPRHRLARLVDEFASLTEPVDRVKRLLACAASLPAFPEAGRVPANRVMGCTAQVWLSVAMDELGRVRFAADSDTEITKGFCACLLSVLDGALPEEVLEMTPEAFGDLNVVGLPVRAHSRVNMWHNVLISMQKRTKALIAKREGRPSVDPFPSLVIGPDGIEAKGGYAEAQVSSFSHKDF
ncbi:hypothetical protein B296_00048963 [Ensete ventricosum]|uniref:Fe-S metabolism associated domain-containing protein n=1 Tax=Ensete ventricosum TaxID=4639 RepID=A0A426XZ53_ENSVE|nr:hypothetical protein B296_00048963 [Ensete ventricosum]